MLYDDCLILSVTQETADYLGVSLRTLARYKKHPDKMPEACKKLLRLQIEGNLQSLGGQYWEHFYLKKGLLYIPGFRNGFEPHKLQFLYYELQFFGQAKRDLAHTEKLLEEARAELWAIRKVREAVAVPEEWMRS